MAQITAPIIAITLVLLSVFVPIAFIPGISGTQFRQFAVTISAAMVISALNALTLSPALCAVFLRHVGPRRGIMGRVLGGIDWVRDGYAGIVRRLLRLAVLSLVAVLVFAGGIFGVSRLTPTGFLPEEDQGAFFIAVQLPDGASVARTSEVTKQVEALLKKAPAVDHVLSIIGFSLLDGASEPNSAFMVVRMKPFADRRAATDSVQAAIRQTFGAGSQIRQANVLPFNLLPIIGSLYLRRIRVSARCVGRPGSGCARQCERRPDQRGQPRPAADACVLDFHGDQSVDLSRHRSRQGSGAPD
jgi:multidrug efflux pump subunit AcrB